MRFIVKAALPIVATVVIVTISTVVVSTPTELLFQRF